MKFVLFFKFLLHFLSPWDILLDISLKLKITHGITSSFSLSPSLQNHHFFVALLNSDHLANDLKCFGEHVSAFKPFFVWTKGICKWRHYQSPLTLLTQFIYKMLRKNQSWFFNHSFNYSPSMNILLFLFFIAIVIYRS